MCPWFGRELFSKFLHASVLLFVLTCLCWQPVTILSLPSNLHLATQDKKKSLGLNIALMHVKKTFKYWKEIKKEHYIVHFLQI